ncbi:MAG: hypothetical protein AB7T27_09640 [Kiritimatiellia bacterium]
MTDIAFGCPHCQQPLEAPPEMAGEYIECPTCKQSISIPEQQKPDADSPRTRKKKAPKKPPAIEKTRKPAVSKYVVDFKNDYEASLYDLYANEVVKNISEAKKKKIFQYVEEHAEQLCADEYFLEDVITEFFPSLIRASYLKEMGELDRGYRKEKLQGEYAPDLSRKLKCPKREPNERPATQKQIDYLIALGFKDQTVLSTLGIGQASSMIEQALAYREKLIESGVAGSDDRSKNSSCSCLGVMVIGGILLFFLFLGLISQ